MNFYDKIGKKWSKGGENCHAIEKVHTKKHRDVHCVAGGGMHLFLCAYR